MAATQMVAASADAKAQLDNSTASHAQRKPLANNLLSQQPWPPGSIGKSDFGALQNLPGRSTQAQATTYNQRGLFSSEQNQGR